MLISRSALRVTATGGNVEAEQKAIFADLRAEERSFLAHATQRTRDSGGGFILDAAWSRNLIDSLACARAIADRFGLGAVKVEHSGHGFDGWNPLEPVAVPMVEADGGHKQLTSTGRGASSPTPTDLEALLPIDPVDALVIVGPAVAP